MPHEQLDNNILFILEDAMIIDQEHQAKNRLLEITAYIKQAILDSDPRTMLTFMNSKTMEQIQMPISDIAIDEDGLPMFAAASKGEMYAGSEEQFVVFGWKTRAGKIYTAFYPGIAFTPPSNS